MIEKRADSVMPVVRFSHPIQRALRINENENLEYIYPENRNKRSQDLEPAYHDAGQFYWIKIASFMEHRSVITSQTVPFITSEMEAQDIDYGVDWELAEIKYKQKYLFN